MRSGNQRVGSNIASREEEFTGTWVDAETGHWIVEPDWRIDTTVLAGEFVVPRPASSTTT